MLNRLVSDAILNVAYDWLCKRRREYPDHADIWSFRRNWFAEKHAIQADLSAGDYRYGLLDRITLADGSQIDLWSARDALVLKALAIVLPDALPVSPRCTHIKGNGGAKSAVRQVMAALGANVFVMRTDVKSYYASIDHLILLDHLAVYIKDRRILSLVGQYLKRTAERGGSFWNYDKGISLGCSLSPLIGAFFLRQLDERITGVFYVRFMDDILILAPNWWKLRRAVKLVNNELASLNLKKHPDKTFIGRISHGFDFLGYHFAQAGLSPARTTIRNALERAARLYEQGRRDLGGPARLGQYLTRWCCWLNAGLGGLSVGCCLLASPAETKQTGQSREQ